MSLEILSSPSEVEADRLRRLDEKNHDERTGWAERFAPGSFGHHELLDRAALVARLVEETILDHPACALDPDWYALADRAVSALNELYQRVGSADCKQREVKGVSYSDFSLGRALKTFGLEPREGRRLFEGVPEPEPSPLLRDQLAENVSLALAIHTEKARSELIVAPILVAVRRLMDRQISLFSGITFDIDKEDGLCGVCDFILSRGPSQFVLTAPVVTIVEAKDDSIKSGLGQCVAAMVAARLFNEREKQGPKTIYGAVTTGSLWRFLMLEGDEVFFDRDELTLDHLGKILAALVHGVGGPLAGLESPAIP